MVQWFILLLVSVASYTDRPLGTLVRTSDIRSQHISEKWPTDGKGSDPVLIYNGSKEVLLSYGEVDLKKGEIVAAGSATCLSSCDKYTASHLKEGPFPYLDSSVVIGYRADLEQVLPDNLQDTQRVLSELYLSAEQGVVSVDVYGDTAALLTNTNYKTVKLEFSDTSNTLYLGGRAPEVLLLSDEASLPTRRLFGELGRYVGDGVTKSGCNFCTQDTAAPPSSLFIVVYIEEHFPFLLNLLKSLDEIEYDKGKVEVVILALEDMEIVQSWKPKGFKSFTLLDKVESEEHDPRNYFLELFRKSDSGYLVYLDSSVYITPATIPQLVLYGKPVISPMLLRRDGTAWSNFWGSYSASWSYRRSADYDNIVTRTVRSLVPVFCLRNMYIIRRDVAVKMAEWNVFDNHLETDISFCKTLNEKRVLMFVSNVMEYGWLKNRETQSDIELWDQYSEDWKMKYLIKKDLKAEDFTSPCKQVYQHKSVFTEDFGKELVAGLDQVGGDVYQKKPKYHERPGFDMSKTQYNGTLAQVILDISAAAVAELYPGYIPRRHLYDSWIIEVEGVLETQRRDVNRGHEAAYHVLVPLNHFNPSDEEYAKYHFPRQDYCKISQVSPGDVFIFPGFITHQKVEKNLGKGIHNYLELSFDFPN